MFFYDLVLGFIICLFSVFVYIYSSYYLNDKRYQKLFFSLLLVGMTGLLLLYTRSKLSLIFLDIPIIIGYLKGHEKDSIILSILLVLLLSISISILPLIVMTNLLVYLLSYLIFNKMGSQLMNILFCVKSFFLSFISFSIYNHSISLLFLHSFAVILFLYLLINVIVVLLNIKSTNFSQDKLELEKKIFKITHEIKNPIAVCKGYLDMLDTNKQEKVEKYISIVKNEMNRALVIMDDFLSLSNISIRSEILDLYLLIEDISDTMEKLLNEKKVTLEIPKYNNELYIIGDYDRLKQVFINLIKNAYEANANHIKIVTKVIKNNVKIEIIDNGDGIKSGDLKKIGEVFFTTKSTGSGIGVNLSKEIVSLHKGEIKFRSKENQGTTITINLPIEKGIN